jgi:hypothetical protein
MTLHFDICGDHPKGILNQNQLCSIHISWTMIENIILDIVVVQNR